LPLSIFSYYFVSKYTKLLVDGQELLGKNDKIVAFPAALWQEVAQSTAFVQNLFALIF
jgi:hypothetical protein